MNGPLVRLLDPQLSSASVECCLEGEDAVILGEEPLIQEPPPLFNTATMRADDETTPAHDETAVQEKHRDSDEDDDAEEELSWRLDPVRSMSDWTIQIVEEGNAFVQEYYVHKSVVAVGPRRSNYFASIFLKRQCQKQARRSPKSPIMEMKQASEPYDLISDDRGRATRMEFNALAARAFPVLLDFLYSNEGSLDINTDNATALHFLSQHLEMKQLKRKVRDFIDADLRIDNISTYYQHARAFQDARVLGQAEKHCAQHIFEVKEKTVVSILTTVDPSFFLRVVSATAEREDGLSASLRLSLLIAVYCNIHKMELDRDIFLKLTAANHLPELEVKAAKAFLEIEDDVIHEPNQLSSLKDRCIAVLSENWDDACLEPSPDLPPRTGDDDSSAAPIVKMPRLLGPPLQEFTARSLVNAKKRLDRLERELSVLKCRNEELERILDCNGGPPMRLPESLHNEP